MEKNKMKDALRIISNHTGNIERYLQNGGTNTHVVFQELGKKQEQFLKHYIILNSRSSY